MSHSKTNRLALVLFGVYLLLYGGFIVINLFAPDLMETTPFAGVNLAIWYGFGLIFAAILLAFIYGMSGSKQESLENLIAENDETAGDAGNQEVSQ